MTLANLTQSGRGFLAAATLAAGAMAAQGKANLSQEEFLNHVKSGDPQKFLAAWRDADQQEAAVVLPLAALLVSDQPPVAKGACECLKKVVHSSGKTKGDAKRTAVTSNLLQLLEKESAKPVKVFALRSLSLVADGDSVAKISPFLMDQELQEEAIFCLERIPGSESEQAMIQALDKAPDSFKPRVMAALGHRKCAAAVPVIDPYLQSANLDLAMAAVGAIARIGVVPVNDPPDFEQLSYHQKKVLMDNAFRYFDALIAKGNTESPIRFIGNLLNNDGNDEIEEHFICAAIICISKIDNADVVKAMAKQVGHTSYIVRDTAVKALTSMKGNSVDGALKEAMDQAEGDTQKTLSAIIEKRKA